MNVSSSFYLPVTGQTGWTYDRPSGDLNPGTALPEQQPLRQALESLAGDQVNGHQVLMLVRKFGVIQPVKLLDRVFQDVNVDELSEQDWEVILQLSPKYAYLLPDSLKNEKLCLLACKQCAKNITHFPLSVRKKHLPEIVANLSGVLAFLTDEEKTADLFRTLLPDNGGYIERVPMPVLVANPDLLDLVNSYSLSWFFERLPEELQTRDRFFQLVKAEANCYLFKNLPTHFTVDDAFYREVCRLNGAALEFVPVEFQNEALFEIAIESSPQALKFIRSDTKNYEFLCRRAIALNGIALAFVDQEADFFDYDFCLAACQNLKMGEVRNSNNCLDVILQKIPEGFRTKELCSLVLAKDTMGKIFKYLPSNMKNDSAICCQAVADHSKNLKAVPESLKSPELCYLACENTSFPVEVLSYVPESIKTDKFYRKLSRLPRNAMETLLPGIPKSDLRLEHCQSVLARGGWLEPCLHAYSEIDSEIDSEIEVDARAPLVNVEVLYSLYVDHKLCLLSDKRVDSESRRLLIDNLLSVPQDLASLPGVAPQKLYESVNPLLWGYGNPFLPELLQAGYRTECFTPPRMDCGQKLDDYVRGSFQYLQPVAMPAAEPLLNQGSRAELVGGRTLKVTTGNEVYYYKFQRVGEPLLTLFGEGLAHEFLRDRPGVGTALKSDLPYEPAYFRLSAAELNRFPAFRDPVQLNEAESGQAWVNVYRYKATEGYSIYAHQPDHRSEEPFGRPEQGILRFCHDAGVFTGMGLSLVSTLPAFHDTASKRRWTPLHSILGFGQIGLSSGTFGAWNTTATEYPDIGYSGLRDVYDVELFGALESFVARKDGSRNSHPQAVQQRLMLANGCVENLLAAILVRSRLWQQFPDYHYKNPDALGKAEAFIEQALCEFVQGYYSDALPACYGQPFDLKKFLDLEDEHYKGWLTRSAQELVYWTAAQPDRESPDLPAYQSSDSEFDHSDCYALHIRKRKRLDPVLYPAAIDIRHQVEYPDNFINCDGHLNLGSNGCFFPLESLSRGLTRLVTRILVTPAQQPDTFS